MMRAISLLVLLSVPLAADALEDGLQAFAQGRYAEAVRVLQQAPAAPLRELFLALSKLGASGCGTQITTDLSAQVSQLEDVRLKRLAGLALAQCQPAPEALATLQALEAAAPGDADVLYQIARVHLRAWNETVQALYQRAPASYRVNQLSAEILEIQGKLPEAEAEFRKAIAKNPQALNLHFRLGRVLLLQAQGAPALAAARAEFERELALNPADAAAEFQIGQLLLAEGQAAEARTRLESALRLRPAFREALFALAKLEAQQRHYERAIPLLEELVRLQPNHEGAQYNLMLAYRATNQPAKAQAAKAALDRLQKPPEGEFTEFLRKLGEKKP
jgi:tetratricopeptide (TPR) repeat protein